jgi:hypothetical protein
MMRRRRPLMRGAMVAGGAYAVGKHSANKANATAQANAEQDARISQLEAEQQAQQAPPPQQYAPPPPPAAAPAPAGDDTMDRLEKLATMHGSGALTDEEYAAAKAKLLGI